jgi:hypothetical protein
VLGDPWPVSRQESLKRGRRFENTTARRRDCSCEMPWMRQKGGTTTA